MAAEAERLLELAVRLGALTYGQFTLSSGKVSPYYFDGRLLTLDPEGAFLVGPKRNFYEGEEGRRGRNDPHHNWEPFTGVSWCHGRGRSRPCKACACGITGRSTATRTVGRGAQQRRVEVN